MLETKRLSELGSALDQARQSSRGAAFTPSSRVVSDDDLSSSVANLCGVLTPRLRGKCSIRNYWFIATLTYIVYRKVL